MVPYRQDNVEKRQGDRKSFGMEAGRQEIIWKGGRTTGDHLERRQVEPRRKGCSILLIQKGKKTR